MAATPTTHYFSLILPDGSVIQKSHSTAFVLKGNFHRYERRGKYMYAVIYEMHATEAPDVFTLTEIGSDVYDGVL